ncbi:MAG: D-xylose transport system permease protein [Frankiales bacterium]|jgi:D-xylose transport system permease protein|nr:D-xylose transport system permease protein [Frankiales bacterium]
MTSDTTADVAHDESDDPRASFRVDTLPRGLRAALEDYVVRVRRGDPGGLPAVLGLLVIGVLFSATTPLFLTAANIGNLMSQASFIALIALGLVFVLILGDIDLSAGATGGVAAGFAAQALRSGDLHHAVGSGVYTGLILGMALAAALAIWKRLYVAGALVLAGIVLLVTGADETHVWLAFALAGSIGVAIGVFNGVLVTSLGIPSFIVTLALFLTWEGVTLDAVNSQSIGTSNYKPWFSMTHDNMSAAQGWIFLAVVVGGYGVSTVLRQQRRAREGVSFDRPALTALRVGVLAVAGVLVVWWFNQNRNPNPGPAIKGVPWAASVPVAFMVVFTIVLARTSWGRHLYAIGGSREAATRAGIAVDRVRIGAFVLCSTMAAVGGLFLADFSGGAQPALGQGNTLLYSVAAAVIGGTSLFGGRGRPRDAILGAVVIAMIPNGIQLHPGLPISVVQEITGLVLLVAASVDAISRRRSRNA